MIKWLTLNHDNLFAIMLTNLCIAILPDAVLASATTHDVILSGVSIMKEIIQSLAGLTAMALSVMLICINYPKFMHWLRKEKKHLKKNDRTE